MTYYVWFALFAIITYIAVSDKNVSDAFVYIFDITKNNIIKQIWWLKNNPRTPWAKYSMWRRSNQLAKELMDELQSKNK
jgi:hypothetical protein